MFKVFNNEDHIFLFSEQECPLSNMVIKDARYLNKSYQPVIKDTTQRTRILKNLYHNTNHFINIMILHHQNTTIYYMKAQQHYEQQKTLD